MRAEVKKENGREVYRRSDKKEIIGKIKLIAISFLAGVILTLMFYPIMRP